MVLGLFTSVAPAAQAAGSGQFDVSARRITYYSDRFVIAADDNVVIHLPDGTALRGQTFAMDLRLNRFVIAGDVRLITAAATYEGAAFAKFFDYDRAYFVPITSEPDRWTFVGGDWSHPLRGREMPGDTFALPDLQAERPFLYATKALIVPKSSVRFTPVQLNTGLALIPAPSYFLNFAANPNFAQNALAGAYADAPYPFAGGGHALATAHLRYDQPNKLYAAYEQHLVSDRSYLVASVNPLTRPQKQFNLLAFDRLSPKTQIQGLFQVNTFQHGFSQPLASGGFLNVQATAGLRRSFLQLNMNAFYDSLLADPAPLNYYGDPSHNFVPDHPLDTQLAWTGFDQTVRRLPFTHLSLGPVPITYRLRSGIGLAHNGTTPPQVFGGTAYPTIWQHFAGLTLAAAPVHALRDHRSARNDVLFTATFDGQRQWFSVPHHIDTATTTLSLSKIFHPTLLGFVSYSIANLGDAYGARQLEVYPIPTTPIISPVTGESFPGYAAFRGFATTRSLIESLVYTPNPRFSFTLTGRQNHDFPAPIPQPTGQPQVGVSPLQLSGDLRLRLNRSLVLDLGRSYYFGFGNQRFSPQFGIRLDK